MQTTMPLKKHKQMGKYMEKYAVIVKTYRNTVIVEKYHNRRDMPRRVSTNTRNVSIYYKFTDNKKI